MDFQETDQPMDLNAPVRKSNREGESLYKIAWKRFLKHPMAKAAMIVLGVLYLVSTFADFLAPYSERFGDAAYSFSPPTQIHFRDLDGNLTRPFIYGTSQKLNMQTFRNEWTVDYDKVYPIKFFVRNTAPRERYVPFPISLIPAPIRENVGIRPTATLRLFGVDAPARIYLWGADDVGSDIYGKVLYGGRISLTIGILASVVTIVLGLLLGGLAGFYGGWVDELILRLDEALSAIPGIFLLISLAAIFYPLNWPPSYVFMAVVVALSIISWGGVARSVRGMILSTREQEFTFAAKALGATDGRIIGAHLLPQTLTYVVIIMSLNIPAYILTEATLSFYGLGIQRPATSWGNMLSSAQSFAGVTGLTDRWWIFIPGIFIFISVLAWNLMGDGLRDAFDPKSKD
jgi:peptide/nickel transport system permease protein